MFAIAKPEPAKGLVATDVSQVTVRTDEVRIGVTHAGICGTDMHIYQWDDWAKGRIKPPLVIGHEFVGEIIEVGSSVTEYSIGQRVSAECHIVCGVCTLCRTGRAHLCDNTNIVGVDRQGAFCEELVIPARNLWPINSKIADSHAAIFDPLGNAMHTVTTHPVAGQNVLISGAGAIGLAAVAMAKANGALTVTVVEPNAYKREIADTLGADLTLDPTKDDVVAAVKSHIPTVLLEMSGNEQALITGLNALEKGGKAALLGIPSKPVSLDLAELVIFKGLTLSGVIGRKMFETWYQVDNFVCHNPDAIDHIVTHTLPATEFQEAFNFLEQGKAIKAVLSFK